MMPLRILGDFPPGVTLTLTMGEVGERAYEVSVKFFSRFSYVLLRV